MSLSVKTAVMVVMVACLLRSAQGYTITFPLASDLSSSASTTTDITASLVAVTSIYDNLNNNGVNPQYNTFGSLASLYANTGATLFTDAIPGGSNPQYYTFQLQSPTQFAIKSIAFDCYANANSGRGSGMRSSFDNYAPAIGGATNGVACNNIQWNTYTFAPTTFWGLSSSMNFELYIWANSGRVATKNVVFTVADGCALPSNPQHGTYSGTLLHGFSAQLTCDPGYHPTGATQVCNDGSLQGTAPQCVAPSSSSAPRPSSSAAASSGNGGGGGSGGVSSSANGGGGGGGGTGSPESSSSSVPIGAVAGGAAGGVVVIGVLVFCVCRRQRQGQRAMANHHEKLVKSTDRATIAMEEGAAPAAASTASASAAAAAKKEKDAQEKAEKQKREEEAQRKKEEEIRKKREEEGKKKEEEIKKKEEEAKKKEEESRKKKEEDTRKKEEEKRHKDEEKKIDEKVSNSPKGSPPSPASSMNGSGSSGGMFSGSGASSLNLTSTSSTSSLVGTSSPSPKAVPTSTVLAGISGFPLLPSSTVDKTHPESLRWVLADRAALTAFVAFLKSELSDENIGFYMAVESYRAKFKAAQASHPTFSVVQVAKSLEKDAAAIFKQYLQTNNVSSKTVNLPEEVSARLVKNLRAFHTTGTYADAAKPENDSRESWPVPEVRIPFDEPQEAVYKLMETDSLRRFIKSDEGKEAMSKAGVH